MRVKPEHVISNNRGFGVLEPLVGTMVLGVLIIAAGTGIQAYTKFQTHRAIEGNIEALRQKFRGVLSCEKTLEDPSNKAKCNAPGGNFISGKKKDGTEIIPHFDPLAVTESRYSVRMLCRTFPHDSSFYEVVPEFAVDYQLSTATPPKPSFYLDPFNKKTYQWASLFQVPLVCSKTPSTPPVVPPTPPVTPPNVPVPTPTVEPCTPGITKNLLTFEDFNEGAYVDSSMNSQLAREYGVTFNSGDGGDLRVAKIVREGEPDPLFSAWLSILCPKAPNHNRICNSDPAAVGRRALSTDHSLSTKDISFEIYYIEPVQDLSFDILDLDGQERWVFSAYDEFDNTITPIAVSSSAGYGKGTGNNAATNISMSVPERSIRKLRFVGKKNIRLFGFGFDNFKTGLRVCPRP